MTPDIDELINPQKGVILRLTIFTPFSELK